MNTYQREELRSWLKALGFVALLGGTVALLVLAGLSTIGGQ